MNIRRAFIKHERTSAQRSFFFFFFSPTAKFNIGPRVFWYCSKCAQNMINACVDERCGEKCEVALQQHTSCCQRHITVELLIIMGCHEIPAV